MPVIARINHEPHVIKPLIFPAGEVHLRNLPFNLDDVTQIELWWRGNHADLAVINQLQSLLPLTIPVVVPYFPASRADRVQGNEALGIASYANLINAHNLHVWEHHSYDGQRIITNTQVTNLSSANYDLIQHNRLQEPSVTNHFVMNSKVNIIKSEINQNELHNYCVLAPDKGALPRCERIANLLNVPLLQATKQRDYTTGKLTGVSVEPSASNYLNILVFDDICDGGSTFIQLAEEIRKHNPTATLSLYVTHGIFSKGKQPLEQYYQTVYAINDWTTEDYPYFKQE